MSIRHKKLKFFEPSIMNLILYVELCSKVTPIKRCKYQSDQVVH